MKKFWSGHWLWVTLGPRGLSKVHPGDRELEKAKSEYIPKNYNGNGSSSDCRGYGASTGVLDGTAPVKGLSPYHCNETLLKDRTRSSSGVYP